MSRFSSSGHEEDGPVIDADPMPVPKLGGFEVMNRAIDIAQGALMRHTLATYPPDLLIEVPRTACRSLEFYRATEVIEIGQELAALALDTFVDRVAETTASESLEPETDSEP
jgi:NTE family protein